MEGDERDEKEGHERRRDVERNHEEHYRSRDDELECYQQADDAPRGGHRSKLSRLWV